MVLGFENSESYTPPPMLNFQRLGRIQSNDNSNSTAQSQSKFGSPVKLRRGSEVHTPGKPEDVSGRPPCKLPIDLELNLESPPCVLYGSATDSAGAVLCGQFVLRVKDPQSENFIYSVDNQEHGGRNATQHETGYNNITITSVHLKFVQKVTYNKPFIPDSSISASSTALQLPANATGNIINCKNCKVKYTSLKSWNIQSTKKLITIGKHAYPFSYLVPGSVPSTSALGLSANTKIQYELVGNVSYYDPVHKDKEYMLNIKMPIPVTRSIHRGPDKNSLRVFPPTQLTAAAVLPNVVYPKSTFPLEMKLNGISSPSTGKGSDKRWRMRKLAWRVEETTRVKTNVCTQHKPDLKKLEDQVKLKEEERSKKPPVPIKRYGDIGPQIRIALSSPSNMPLSGGRSGPQPTLTSSEEAPNSVTLSSREGEAGNIDTDENETTDQFVHPSDDAMRQELLQQQQRQREQQLKQELKNSSALFSEEVRIISKGEMKSGWKTDFDSDNGKVELVTDIDLLHSNSGVSNPIMHTSTTHPYKKKPDLPPVTIACDIQDPNLGIYVNHTLAIEIVVAEEALQYANGQPIRNGGSRRSSVIPEGSKPEGTTENMNDDDDDSREMDQRLLELSPMFANRNAQRAKPVEYNDLSPVNSRSSTRSGNNTGRITPHMSSTPRIVSVPTGAARVLRMQFRINVTERSGLGISWDEEVPPMYHEIQTNAPPSYEAALKDSGGVQIVDNSEDLGEEPEHQTPIIAFPPMAHHNNSNIRNNLTTVQSPQLENIISIQGAVPYGRGSPLTPNNTIEMGIRNLSEVLDTDRITQ